VRILVIVGRGCEELLLSMIYHFIHHGFSVGWKVSHTIAYSTDVSYFESHVLPRVLYKWGYISSGKGPYVQFYSVGSGIDTN
jgi:hypothetical protein